MGISVATAAAVWLASGATATSALSPSTPWGFDLAGRDLKVSPGTDFYRYANGGWLDRAVIVPGSFKTGPGEDADHAAQLATRSLVEAKAADPRDTSRVAVVYRAYMDRATVESKGATPLAPLLAGIVDVRTKAGFAHLMSVSLSGFRAVSACDRP